MGPKKVALFDLDNTLFDRTGAYRKWASRYVEEAALGEAEIDWFCQIDDDGFADRSAVWARAKQRYGLRASIPQLVANYRLAYLESCIPDKAVLAALAELREADWRIGVVTNGPMPHQAHKADRLGLLPLVDAFCGSGDLGVEKPDQQIFNEALTRCAGETAGVSPDCWMVGDAPIPDIFGGRRAGLQTIWLDRGRKWNPSHGDPPDLTVGSPIEAVQHILSQEDPGGEGNTTVRMAQGEDAGPGRRRE